MSNQLLQEILDELKSQMNNRFDTLDTKISTVEVFEAL